MAKRITSQAEDLMNLHPWDLWQKDGQPQPWTPEILNILESILKRNPRHIASIHLYIHATEASFTPELQKREGTFHRKVPSLLLLCKNKLLNIKPLKNIA